MKKEISLAFIFFAVSVIVSAQTLKDALRLTDNEQYESATEVLKKLIAKEPNNALNYFYLGENYLLSDNADSALMTYERGKKIDAGNVLFLIGNAKYNLNKFSIAERKRLRDLAAADASKAQEEYNHSAKTSLDLVRLNEAKAKAGDAEATHQTAVALVSEANALIEEALIKSSAKNPLALIEAADALIHFRNQNLDKAKTILDKAYGMDPKNPDVLILFGDVYSELNNGTLAADYYNKALDLDNHSVKAIVAKGRLYKRSTNFEGAAEEFKKAIAIDPDFAPEHRELGEVDYKIGHLEEAKAEYKKYLELSKNNCDARRRYASFLYLSKDYAGTIVEIKQIEEHCDKKNLTLLRISTYCYYETKDTANALVAVQNLFSNLPEEKAIAQDYEYYGKILALIAKDSLAVGMLRTAYRMDNTRCDLLNEMWKCYDRMKKNHEAAEVLLEKIQSCKGATTTDYFNMGRSLFFAGEFNRADSAFAHVNETSPKYASGFLWRAKTNSHIDSTSALGLARPHYEKYIEVASADTAGMTSGKYKSGLIESYRYQASYFYYQTKEKEKAKECLRKILVLDATDADAKQALNAMEQQEKQERDKEKLKK